MNPKLKYSSKTLINISKSQHHSTLEENLTKNLQHFNIYKTNARYNSNKHRRKDYTLTTIVNWNIEGYEGVNKNSPDTDLFKNADLVMLTETLDTEDKINHPGYYKISSLALKPDKGRPVGGMALLYKPHLELIEVSKSDNKIHATTPFGHIFSYYYNPDTNIADIIEEITHDISNIDNTTTCIIGGDFNCRMDSHCTKGDTLLHLMNTYHFRLMNDPNEPTYYAHNGTSTIDLLFVRSKKINVLYNFNVLNDPIRKHQRTFSTIRLKKYISIKANSKTKISRKVDEKRIALNPISSKLQPENVNDIIQLNKILVNSAKKKITQKHHKPWFDLDCKNLKQEILAMVKHTTYGPEITALKKKYKILIKQKRTAYEENQLINKCKSAKSKPWIMFETKGSKPHNTIKMNTLITHFEKLFTIDNNNTIETINTTDDTLDPDKWYNKGITDFEIENAMKLLKNRKAPGNDQVFNEHIKSTYNYFKFWWLMYLNNLFNNATIPDTWRTATINILYKGKGNSSDPNNYRGIALLSVTYKLYTKILNIRIMTHIDSKLPPEQYGFRNAKNCQQAINILRTTASEILRKPKGSLYCVFVDFCKAFDSINRHILLEKLKDFDIKGKLFNAIRNILSINYLQIDNGIEKSNNLIKQQIGVIQGDPISSTLFLIYIAKIPEILNKIDTINVLMFADDLVFFSEHLESIQTALDELLKYCIENKLQLNTSKTKIIKLRKGGKLKKSDHVTYNKQKIEFVNEYEYLGVTIQPTLAITKHIEKKKIKSNHVIGTIQNLQKLSITTINKIFMIKIWPIMCYSIETYLDKISSAHLIDFDRVKANLYKRGLCLHKNASNTLVFHMSSVKRFGEEIIEKYNNQLLETTIQEYQSIVEEKNMKFAIEKYTDGPAFSNNTWKKANQANRHLITRFTVHGFHQKFCKKASYHNINIEECQCKICNEKIEDRYHLYNHIDLQYNTLTSFLENLS